MEEIERIKAIIKNKGLKQSYVATMAGFTEKSFSNLLNGRKTFKAEYVPCICKALNVLPNDLFGIERK